MPGKLYLVATPIGNLNDFSQRGIQTLEQVDFIAAEDTRVTRKLLTRYEIQKPLVSYHEHNKKESGEKIINRILQGETCALVSDAGTPVINDPGADLVSLCIENEIDVLGIPGPCAAISALILSGLDAKRFSYEGFLEQEKKERKKHLSELAEEHKTMILYEAPHHLKETLKDLAAVLGDRQIAICRELTKIHEEVMRTTLLKAIDFYKQNDPRGEYVLILKGAEETAETVTVSLEQATDLAREYITQGMSRKDAARTVAEETGVSRKLLYGKLF